MNNVALAVALATAPTSAFAELRERPRFWFPLLLLVLTTAGITFWYYSVVDIEWLKDMMFANNPDVQKLGEAERAQMLSMYGRKTMLWGGLIGTFVAIPAALAVQALYWVVASKLTKLSPGFKHWFAFAAWTTLPLLIGSLIAAIFLVMADTPQISPGTLAPLSLNELLFHRPFGSPGHTLLETLGIPAFLSWVLMIIGVHSWSQRSWLFSTIFVLLPSAIFYGIWAFIAFR